MIQFQELEDKISKNKFLQKMIYLNKNFLKKVFNNKKLLFNNKNPKIIIKIYNKNLNFHKIIKRQIKHKK